MAKKWHYSTASNLQAGDMICTSCKRKITEGEFRVRETDEAYLSQHRECSESDPMWAKLDSEKAKALEASRKLLAAAIAFRDKWGVSELNDLIEALEGEQ